VSSGQHHAGMTKGIASGVALGAASSYFLSPAEISLMAVGCLLGLFLTPDADVDGGHIANYYVRKVSGRMGEWVWNLIWTPYQRGLRHRSFWSHTPIIGTTVRLIYLILPAIILFIKDQSSTSIFEIIPKAFIAQIVTLPFTALLAIGVYSLWTYTQVDLTILGLALFTGLSISDVGHWALDL